jgi:hypothetical protein
MSEREAPMTLTEWAKSMGCPRCGVGLGFVCRSERGRGVRPHKERIARVSAVMALFDEAELREKAERDGRKAR